MHSIRHMPISRKFANLCSSAILSKITKQRINDSQSGYRLIKTDVLKRIKINEEGYQIETELLLKAAKKGFKIINVPIKTIYAGEKSHVRPFKTAFRFLRVVTKNIR